MGSTPFRRRTEHGARAYAHQSTQDRVRRGANAFAAIWADLARGEAEDEWAAGRRLREASVLLRVLVVGALLAAAVLVAVVFAI